MAGPLKPPGEGGVPSGAAGGELGGSYPNPTVDDGADGSAIHDNVAAEIFTVTNKASPAGGDLVLIEDSADSYNKKSVTISALSGGSMSIPSGNTVWVDSVGGNDGTGTSGRQDLPFATVAAAIAVSVSGDVIKVRPGLYAEAGLVIPSGVSLVGDGWQTTSIGAPGALSDIITLSSDSGVVGITVVCPSGAGLSGLVHNAGTGNALDLNFAGDGASGSGNGIFKTGTGKLIGGNIRFETGGFEAFLRVDSGVLALDATHMPNAAGSVDFALLAEGTGRYQGQGFNCGNPNVVDAVALDGTSTVILYSPNIFNCTNALRAMSDGINITCLGGKIDNVTRSFLVDSGLTGTGSKAQLLSTVLPPVFDFPAAAAINYEFALNFSQLESSVRESKQRVIGSDLALGFPELASALIVGEGSSYGDGLRVCTSDSTATSTTVGGNITDVTVEATSISGSTFTFQGTAANHCVYIATARTDGLGNPLKHWGLKTYGDVAGVGGSYVFEIWDGSAWTDIGVMATSQEEVYRYANQVFIRASSNEYLSYGIDSNTTWVASSVDGTTAYWVRIRIDSTVTTLPTWERMWVSPTHVDLTGRGLYRALGLAQWKQTIFSGGNVFGEQGGVVSANIPVGTGASPASWTHNSPNSLFNQTGDEIHAQFAIPDGTNTAFPIEIEVLFGLVPGGTLTSPVTGTCTVLPVEAAFNTVADPSGGLVPTLRTVANTETTTAKGGTTYTFDSSLIGTNWPGSTIYKASFGPYGISNYYAEDALFVRFEMTSDGTPTQDVYIVAVIVKGVKFTQGQPL